MGNPMMLGDMFTLYHKPSMGGQLILRKPRSVQTSARVKAQQMVFADKMRGKKIATECKGRKGRAFYGCLRSAGTRAYHGR
jgi:hypothetical protein